MAARRAKRPRVVAAPQHLPVAAQLTGSHAELKAAAKAAEAAAAALPATQLAAEANTRSAGTLDSLRSKDQDPAGWGEKDEDLAAALKREVPPHW